MHQLPSFSLKNKIALVAGGGGVLGGAMAQGLAAAGARVAVANRTPEKAERVVEAIKTAGGTAQAFALDASTRAGWEACVGAVEDTLGPIAIFINAVGGNRPDATATPHRRFFDLPEEALGDVVDLNFTHGTVVAAQVVAEHMTRHDRGGSIIHISSMAAQRPLTRVVGYSASKAAVDNFTRWLAVHLATEHDPRLRVNAIAPGFFLTDQNRFLLTDEQTGEATARGRTILAHTPMGRYGDPDELAGAAVWLASDAARFVTGTVIPVDGGFSAFSGV